MHLLDDETMNAARDLAFISQARSMPKNLNEPPSPARREGTALVAQPGFLDIKIDARAALELSPR